MSTWRSFLCALSDFAVPVKDAPVRLAGKTICPEGLEVFECLREEFHGESDDVGRRAFEEGQPGWSVLEA